MPTTKLIEVKSYLDRDVFEWMEGDRGRMRRTSQSRYIQDCIVERMERKGRPIQDAPGTRKRTTE